MSLRASLLVTLAAILPSASGCGARSDLSLGGLEGPPVGGHGACANGSRAGAVGCGSVTFADAVSYPVGAGLRWWQLVVVDLNGDGALDIAASVGTTVTVLLNQGNGVFSSGGSYPTSMSTTSGLAAGDLNDDGFVDLVVGCSVDEGNFVSVLLNDGHGAFAPGVLYLAGLSPTAVALGDLDGDGLLDIATANTRGDDVSVLSNLGDGTFGLLVTLGPVHLPTSIAAADLDRDGRLDLAVTSGETSGRSVFLNAGGGTFGDSISYPDPGFSFVDSLVVADVSGDGWPDLIFHRGVGFGVQLNAGGGAFRDVVSYPGPSGGVVLGDLNGDCRLDVTVIGHEGSPKGDVQVWPNLGDGTFGPAAARIVGGRPQSVAVGDVDGDGRDDLIVAYGDTNVVSVLRNRGCAP
jgi:hypothetical protein